MSTNKPPLSVPCPTCGTAVEWIPENRFKPFCSERCKLIDLGQWATEAYRVPGSNPSPDDDADSDKLN